MITDPSKPKPLTEELAWALDVAQDRVTLARQLLRRLRSVVRIGRLSIAWIAPASLDPVRLGADVVNIYDVVTLSHETQVGDAGVRVDHVLLVNGQFRIIAETRFYSLDFYRSAIAKFFHSFPDDALHR